jgi:hypothetical protein
MVSLNFCITALAALAFVAAAADARAQTGQYVVDGGFENPGTEVGFVSGSYSGAGNNSDTLNVPTGWTAFGAGSQGTNQWNGFVQNSAVNTGALGGVGVACSFYSAACNGTTLQPGGSQNDPNGGYFVSMDGDSNIYTGIEQTLTGLKVGQTYVLTFDYGAIQREAKSGSYTDHLVVTIGTNSFQTQTFSEAPQAFSGWFVYNYQFVATSTSEVLSFLSEGNPVGLPPSAVLDGVSVTAPEPASWGIMLAGLGGLAALGRRRRARAGCDAIG